MANIAILGCGFGTALAVMLDAAGHKVTCWSKYQQEIDAILRDKEHKKLLPGVKLSETIAFTSDPSCVTGADLLIIAIPSQYVREAVSNIAPHVSPETVLLNVGKGFEENTFNRLSQVISDVLPDNPVVVMAGPCHAEEVARGVPTSVVVASDFPGKAAYVQEMIMSPTFRVYLSDDVIGCEAAPALKNAIALCCGIAEGMGLGDNTLAALMTRGLTEITRLGVAMGAKWETFTGLAGVGDLIVTCTSVHSRNHRAGLLIGKGEQVEKAVEQVGTVEGYGCCKITCMLSEKMNVQMPIVQQLYNVCFNGVAPYDAVKSLMTRPKKEEKEPFWK
ncbi:MAG: NAD(P)-dependent glycerol-3-phosphate dehydrogenase [Oscillospiraceae bacterium]|nr:NAD(P)-dependent glycerol-3-phosphate dehydrogenase [Oscillospiraceae bacterium]